MIQTNPQADTISGYFGITPDRKDELDQQFKEIRNQQKELVLNDIIKTYRENGIEHIGYHRVPVLHSYMSIAKNEPEQIYVAFMAQHELEFFSTVMKHSVRGALLNYITDSKK